MTEMQTTTTPRLPGAFRMGRLIRSSQLSATVGSVILIVIVAAALLAPLIAPYPPNKLDVLNALQAPSWSHLMGTDDVGRDVFSRVLYGVRLDLVVVLLVTYLPLPVGVLLGAIAGYFRGVTDGVISRIVDVVIAFPFLVLVIAVVAITGPGLKGAIIGILVGGWAMYARLARGEMLVLREQQFMLAARALGYSSTRSIVRHALPNLLRSSVVFSAADIVINLLLLAGLSFLGLGVQPPRPSSEPSSHRASPTCSLLGGSLRCPASSWS